MTAKKILTRTYPVSFDGEKWTYGTDEWVVRVMAEAEGYAMVRRPRAIPFVCQVKDLRDVD